MKNVVRIVILLLVSTFSFSSLHGAGTIIINPENKANLSNSFAQALLIGKRKYWDDGSKVVIVLQQGNAQAAIKLKELTGMDEEKLNAHWKRLTDSGRGTMPKLVKDPTAIANIVASNKGAIAIVSDNMDLSAVRRIY